MWAKKNDNSKSAALGLSSHAACEVRGRGRKCAIPPPEPLQTLWAIVTCGVRGAGERAQMRHPPARAAANSMGYRHMRRARCGGVAHVRHPPARAAAILYV